MFSQDCCSGSLSVWRVMSVCTAYGTCAGRQYPAQYPTISTMNVVSPLEVKLIWMKKKRPNKVIQAQASLLMLLRTVTCFSVRISQTISTCTLITMVTGSYPSHGGHIRDPMHKLPLPKVTAKTAAMPALTDMCCSFCCQ